MSKKIIVFDLDDTLISERDYIESGFNFIAKIVAKDFELSDYEVKNKMDELFAESTLNVFNRLLDFFKISYTNDYIKKLIKEYRNHLPTIELLDDAKEILDYLLENNYRLGMITDGYKEAQRKKIEVLGIEKYFEHIIVTDELGREFWKPSEVPYRIIKEKFKCNYEDMVYIGDNLEKDFITANKLGIDTVQIIRENMIYKKSKEKNYNAKLKIISLKNIIEILKGK